MANAYAAMEHDLTIVPVLNKVDLQACPARGGDGGNGIEPGDRSGRRDLPCSGKTGHGVDSCSRRSSSGFRRRPAIPNAPAASDGVRFALRRISRRDHLCAADERHGARRARRSASSRPAARYEVLELGQFVPQRRACDAVAGRPGRLSDLQHQIAEPGPHRRHGDHARRQPGRGPARLSRAAADGLLRAVSFRRPEFRGAARRADQAEHQRSQLRVRAGDERRPGLRLPLRLSGPAAHGDHPAAAGRGSRISTWCRPPPT